MATGAQREERQAPGKGERQFLTVLELRRTPDEFAEFAKCLPADREFLSALQMCFREPQSGHWGVLYHTLCGAAERYAIRRATADMRRELEAAQELPLFETDTTRQ